MRPDLYRIDGPWPGRLAILSRPRGDEWLRDEIRGWVDSELSELLSRGKSIGIHCRQGIGRSSLLAACLLSQFNVSVDEAFRQIQAARRTSVPDTAEQRQWVNTFSDRIKHTTAEHHVS